MARHWTRCSCGHIAQDHNSKTGNEGPYPCDFCLCQDYDGHAIEGRLNAPPHVMTNEELRDEEQDARRG